MDSDDDGRTWVQKSGLKGDFQDSYLKGKYVFTQWILMIILQNALLI